jgi:hypothetical protein
MWLRDSLPYDLTWEGDDRPLARVMIYGYESSVPQSKNIQNLEDLSTSFHHGLLGLASAPTIRPIIFVAHSLGGLIVKQVGLPFMIRSSTFSRTRRPSYHSQNQKAKTTRNWFERYMESSSLAFHMMAWISARSFRW